MLEMALGMAFGAGTTWLMSRLMAHRSGRPAGCEHELECYRCHEPVNRSYELCRGCGEPLAHTVQASLNRLDDANQLIESMARQTPSAAFSHVMDDLVRRRLDLLGWRAPESIPLGSGKGTGSSVSFANLSLHLLLLSVSLLVGFAGIWFSHAPGASVLAPSGALAGLSIGALLASYCNLRFPWVAPVSLALLMSHATMALILIVGRTEIERQWLETLMGKPAWGALAVSGLAWLMLAWRDGFRLTPGSTCALAGATSVLVAAWFHTRDMEESLPALIWAAIGFMAIVPVMMRITTGKGSRTPLLDRVLHAGMLAGTTLWFGALYKGTPLGQLASLAGAMAVVTMLRSILWRSHGWAVVGVASGCCAVVSAAKTIDMSTGMAIVAAAGWMGVCGIIVALVSRSWPIRHRFWNEVTSAGGLILLLMPVSISLLSHLFQGGGEWIQAWCAANASPLFLMALVTTGMAAFLTYWPRGHRAIDCVVAAVWCLGAGWAANLGAVPALGVLITGGITMACHAGRERLWLPTLLLALAMTVCLGLECHEPGVWVLPLQVAASVGVVAGWVVASRGGPSWWWLSVCAVVPLALAGAGGIQASTVRILIAVSVGWACLALVLRLWKLAESDDRIGSPRLSLVVGSVLIGILAWTLNPAMGSDGWLAGAGLLSGLLLLGATSRLQDLSHRQILVVAGSLVLACFAGTMTAHAVDGGFDTASVLLLALVWTGPVLAAAVGLLLVTGHDLSQSIVMTVRVVGMVLPLLACSHSTSSLWPRLALAWGAASWATLAWLISMDMDRRRQVSAIGWRGSAVLAAVGMLAAIGWALPDPVQDVSFLARCSLAMMGLCLGYVISNSIEAGFLQVSWLTRRACRSSLERLEMATSIGLASCLVLEACLYRNVAGPAWPGLMGATGLAMAFVLAGVARMVKASMASHWWIIVMALGLFLHLSWTSTRQPEENTGLLLLAAGCLVALGGAVHALGYQGCYAYRSAGLGLIVALLALCVLDSRGMPEEGPHRAFLQCGLPLIDQGARGINVIMMLAGVLVVAGLTGGSRRACSAGASLALAGAVARQALDGQPWVAVLPQALAVIALVAAVVRRDTKEVPDALITPDRASRAA